ncbi:unnamed protein product [Linum trigynum]|uniref:RNase H type-1 domain-containing protein n=1 Tax=Linum trigynum TaxID=586398 RepID=A0AAV2G810_9ROSI
MLASTWLLAHQAIEMKQLCQLAFGKVKQAVGDGREKRTGMVGWEKPPLGWTALNTYGYVISSTGSATAGGVIRDSPGRFMRAFSIDLGAHSITHAELVGLYHGVHIASEMGIQKMRLQTDSRTALAIIQSDRDNHPHRTLENSIIELLNREWETTMEHVYQEGNYVAYFMAEVGHSLNTGLHVLDNPGPSLRYWLLFDSIGVQTPRMINE